MNCFPKVPPYQSTMESVSHLNMATHSARIIMDCCSLLHQMAILWKLSVNFYIIKVNFCLKLISKYYARCINQTFLICINRIKPNVALLKDVLTYITLFDFSTFILLIIINVLYTGKIFDILYQFKVLISQASVFTCFEGVRN